MLKLADLDSKNGCIENLHKKLPLDKRMKIGKRNLLSTCSKMGAIGGIKIEAIFQTTNY